MLFKFKDCDEVNQKKVFKRSENSIKKFFMVILCTIDWMPIVILTNSLIETWKFGLFQIYKRNQFVCIED